MKTIANLVISTGKKDLDFHPDYPAIYSGLSLRMRDNPVFNP